MTREERFEEDFERTLAEWIDDGDDRAPASALAAASAHARAHPRRRSGAGLRRSIMDRIHLSGVEAQPRQRGWLLAVGVTIAVGIVAVGLVGTGVFSGGGGPEPLPAVGAPVSTPAASPAPVTSAVPSPTTAPSPSASLWTDGRAAAVSGWITCATITKNGVEQYKTPPITLTGQEMACSSGANDPRVAGTGTLLFDVTGWDPALPAKATNGILSAYQTIRGPEGTWAGRTFGLYDYEGVLHNYGILVGDGAYEGLIFAVSGTVPANGVTADVVGIIQPGSPPPDFPVAPLAAP